MHGWNRIYGTKYSNLKKFILTESNRHGIEEFAYKLGVSKHSISRIKSELRITKQCLGIKTQKSKVIELARAGKTKNMTALEISEAVGYLNMNNVYLIAKQEGFEFKRLWEPRERSRARKAAV